MDRKPLEQMKAVGKYDPKKNYVWNEDDLFTVSGAEIDAWNKALSVVVNTAEYQRFAFIQRGAMLMQDFIKQSVEQDLIKEKVESHPLKVAEDGSAESANG